MYSKLWLAYRESVFSLNYYTGKGIQFYRSTGFRYGDYLISSCNIDKMRKASKIVIRSNTCDSKIRPLSFGIKADKFYENIHYYDKSNLPGLFLMPFNLTEFNQVHFAGKMYAEQAIPGTPVALFSYGRQFDQLCIKSGIVSSIITVKGSKYIYIESSFESGTLGSPVVNAATGEVIGVIADAVPTQSEKHRKLKKVIEENLRLLKTSAGNLIAGNVDPVQVLMVSQNMIKHLATEIFENSQRNYGYALPVEKISRCIRNLDHKKQLVFDPGPQNG